MSSGASPSVDLLRATLTDVAVSSVYRDRREQANRLFDGDLATAWNSRSGELVGAWIELRVPSDAYVESIGMTVGFTSTNASATDLFTGNHRITRVRVLRDGREVGRFALDPARRELQSIPASGAGGVFRIEVAEVLPGSRATWRETCVSELVVRGRVPNASPGAHFPRVSIGALPPPRSNTTLVDRTALGRAHTNIQRRIIATWTVPFEGWMRTEWGTGGYGDDPAREEGLAWLRERERVIRDLSEIVEPIDAVEASALRARSAGLSTDARGVTQAQRWRHEPAYVFFWGEDVAAMSRAMTRIADASGDTSLRCRWTRAVGALTLRFLGEQAAGWCSLAEADIAMGGSIPERAVRRMEAAQQMLARAAEAWPNAVAARRAVERIAPETGAQLTSAWTFFGATIAEAEAHCR